MTWARSSVVMVPSPQISNSLNTSWQGPHHIPALIPRQGQCGKLYHCQYFMLAGWCLMMAPCNPRAVSVTVPQWPSIQIFESEEILRFKMEHLGSVPYLLSWSPHLSDFVPQSKYVHYQIRKYGLDAPNIELSTRRSARFHHWSGAWFRHCDFLVRDGLRMSLRVFSPSFLSLWGSMLHCLLRLNYSEWRYNDGVR